MSRDPAVLFYTSDFLTGTSRMSDEQCGQYIRALCSQHQEGHFQREELLQILKSNDSSVWKKFVQDSDGLFFNERMDEEIEKRITYCNSKSHKGISGRKKKSSSNHMISDRKSTGNHTENENDNVIENGISEGVQGEREKTFRADVDSFLEYPAAMREKFVRYWTEPNKSKTKMRFQLEKTWDTKRRLETWASRDKSFSPVSDREQKQAGQYQQPAQPLPILDIFGGKKN
ncbi:MAG: hypothetical protein WC998_04525 [Candidatus Paceibacterota bacterium]|jgi:hypothetical protein